MTKHINRLGAVALALAIGGLVLPSLANAAVRPPLSGGHGASHSQSRGHSYAGNFRGGRGYGGGYNGGYGGYGGYPGGVYYGGFCGPIQIALGICSPYGF